MECNFLPICYWHELFELVLLFKALNDLVDTSPEVLPKPKLPSRLTRSSTSSDDFRTTLLLYKNLSEFLYEQSHYKVWNILPNDTRKKNNSLSCFKAML
jgi:hypothetical protein